MSCHVRDDSEIFFLTGTMNVDLSCRSIDTVDVKNKRRESSSSLRENHTRDRSRRNITHNLIDRLPMMDAINTVRSCCQGTGTRVVRTPSCCCRGSIEMVLFLFLANTTLTFKQVCHDGDDVQFSRLLVACQNRSVAKRTCGRICDVIRK